MTFPKAAESRQVIPRWLTPAQAAAAGERTATAAPRTLNARERGWLDKLSQRFGDSPDDETGTSLYLAQLVASQPISNAARQIAERSLPVRRLNPTYKGGAPVAELSPSPQSIHSNIGALRKRLRENPHLALDWCELSRHYALIGLADQAKRSMDIAIHVAGPNRYIYRTAVRLFIHQGLKDEAAWLIRHHPSYRSDPWLLATEIAISSLLHKTSRQMRHARDVVNLSGFAPQHTTELAAAIATVELTAGGLKQAKTFYSRSLVSPNDNSLAQIEWAHQKESKMPSANGLGEAKEAVVWRARGDHEWDKIVQGCMSWHLAEPFSAGPMLMGGYFVDVAGRNFSEMEKFSELGLVANPKNTSLLNNNAVALAYTGQTKKALAQVAAAISSISTGKEEDKQDSDDHLLSVLLATLGLAASRGGATERGELLYLRALEGFLDQKNLVGAALASIHWCREEVRLGFSRSQLLIKTIEKGLRKLPVNMATELRVMLEPLKDERRRKKVYGTLGVVEPDWLSGEVLRLEALIDQRWKKRPKARGRKNCNVADVLDEG